jgi:hypothetical protein
MSIVSTTELNSFDYLCSNSQRDVLARVIAALTGIHAVDQLRGLRRVNRALAAVLVDEDFIAYVHRISIPTGIRNTDKQSTSPVLEYYARMPQVTTSFAIEYISTEPLFAWSIRIYNDRILARLRADDICWEAISESTIDDEFIDAHQERLSWCIISYRRDASMTLLDKYAARLNFPVVSRRPLSLWFLDRYHKSIDWSTHSAVCVPAAFDSYTDYIYWAVASGRQDLPAETIIAYHDRWIWSLLLPAVYKCDDILLQCSRCISWKGIDHKRVYLSDDILYLFRDKIDWDSVKRNRSISASLRRRVKYLL